MTILRTDHVITDGDLLDQSHGKGLIPRDFSVQPIGSLFGSKTFDAIRDELPLIPFADMPELSDIRNRGDRGKPIPSLNQGQSNFCWAYASCSAAILLRAVANLPYVRVSAHAVGCKIKNFANQGGWSAASTQFIFENGVPDTGHWIERSFSRDNDKPETWENAKLHKFGEAYVDLDAPIYDRDMSFQQVLTCLLCNIPCPVDYNHWSHAVCGMDAVDVYPSKPATEPGRYGIRIWNSWGDSWSANGTGVLIDSKAVPSNAVAPRTITLSDA
jgi:hypothetical protein